MNQKVYQIKNKKEFAPILASTESVVTALNFAYEMIYGKGHHRPHRSGGSNNRKKGEQFCNAFQGKLGELVVCDYIDEHHPSIECPKPECDVWGKGQWDDTDLILNHRYKISVKSMVYFSNLLLLETKDWNKDGAYIPNINDSKTIFYDFFLVVRIREDIKKIFRNEKLFYNDDLVEKSRIQKLIHSQNWYYDIPGCGSIETLKHLIKSNQIIEKNTLINNRIPMDATNYFCEVFELPPIESMIKKIMRF